MTDSDETKPRVLIVDDEPSNIKVLASTLEHDYTITVASSGKEAIETAAAEPQPDIILLDVWMPDMDGFQVCARLKANELTSQIPVIFVTMIADHINEERGFKVGAVDYIYKPIKAKVIQSRVKIHVRLKQHREFLERLIEQRTDELGRSQEEARKLLNQLREDVTV